MRQSKFAETQIVSILRGTDAGRSTRFGGVAASVPPRTTSGRPRTEA